MGKLTPSSGGQASRLSWPTGFQPVVSLEDRRDALSALTGGTPVLPVLGGPPAYLLACLLLLGILFPAIACAQSNPPVNTPVPPVSTLPPTKGKTPNPKDPEPIKIKPSRYVEEADLDAYVASIASTFSMRDRATDAFGLYQDPDAKPVVKTPAAKSTRRAAPVVATPFSDIIRLIKVTTIMPKDKCFLIGTRQFKQGDNINLSFRGKNIRVEVAAVNSRQIEFRNLDSNESAALPLNVLPAGMTPGTRGITTPGMAPDRPDSPITLDPGVSNTPGKP